MEVSDYKGEENDCRKEVILWSLWFGEISSVLMVISSLWQILGRVGQHLFSEVSEGEMESLWQFT